MKGKKKCLAPALALAAVLTLAAPARAYEAQELVPIGSTVAITLQTDGVMVVGMNEVDTEEGSVCPAEQAGLMVGDMISQIGGRSTGTAAEFLTAVTELDGSEVDITAKRGGKTVHFSVTPAMDADGAYKLGVWLRDGVSGIGTLTFYDPASGVYGALGHGINDLDSGRLLPVGDGLISKNSIVDVVKGESGKPGELCGRGDSGQVLGHVSENTELGIFGTCQVDTSYAALPVASESEVVLGPATILSNVSGDEVREYSVEVTRLYRGCTDGRFMMISVTDQDLLDRTGGIVQGMSGSPIIQNGKLIGAVTHVLISDPTRGYGASIESMLEAAGDVEAAA